MVITKRVAEENDLLKYSCLLPFKCKLCSHKFFLFFEGFLPYDNAISIYCYIISQVKQIKAFIFTSFTFSKNMNIWHILCCNTLTVHQLTNFFRFKHTHCTAYLLSFCTLSDLFNFTNFWTELSLILSKKPKPRRITAATGTKCRHYSHNASEMERSPKATKATTGLVLAQVFMQLH